MSYRKELPEKYYLQHFEEFLSYITSVCEHLLDASHKAYLRDYHALDELSRCLHVRLLNRNISLVAIETLKYSEIPDMATQLALLTKAGFIRKACSDDWTEILPALNKNQLVSLLDHKQVSTYKKSAKKNELASLVDQFCTFDDVLETGMLDDHIVKLHTETFRYLLFLFFGNLDSRLNQFSMRDLGVIQTRNEKSISLARFESESHAKSAFHYAGRLVFLKHLSDEELSDQKDQLIHDDAPDGSYAVTLANKYFLKLSRRLEKQSVEHAIKALEYSKIPESEEQWIRLQYKQGQRDIVQTRLEALLDDAQSEHILLFAEDFLARKFNKKKTSSYTDVLRSANCLSIEELYRNHVEEGVKSFYQNQGAEVYFTENALWRSLFGLVFWAELFEDEASGLCNEFDHRPQTIVQNTFYENHKDVIEARLASFSDPARTLKYITKMLTLHYGKTNGFFTWPSDLLEVLTCFVRHAEPDSVVQFLRLMAKDYSNVCDGFPDLMILEEGKLRFEEVKAPGDQLRKNQLVMLNKLSQCGFDASVTRVEWFIDPNQPYVVVDIETTGGKKGLHRITEIGAVKMVNGEVIDRWESLINPQRHIPSFITKLTGITDEMVATAPVFSEVSESFSSFIEGCIFVAHNVNFDYSFIKDEFERVGMRFNMPKLCSCKEMKRYFPGYESYGLANLCREFEIDLDSHHRALCDAEAAAHLLNLFNEKRMAEKTAEMKRQAE